ncbi:Hypothetical protein FKW44_009827 [Caligus rogercresseyi]|uniref:Uncharacterized protein n=1 Tax=Caligus rogercresseyi TaxID=217165 RepID=A0A7T8K947_CALRO|nr:Hypothetical protein FKW44_009827 [Caligus rogercresseyi]
MSALPPEPPDPCPSGRVVEERNIEENFCEAKEPSSKVFSEKEGANISTEGALKEGKRRK